MTTYSRSEASSLGKRMRSLGLFGIVGAAVLTMGCAHAQSRAMNSDPTPSTRTGPIAAVQSSTASQVLLDRDLVSDFGKRTTKYMKLHEQLQRLGTRQKRRNDVGENLVSQQALAMRIRFARHDARPGDLFTRPIAMALRRAMDPELRGGAALQARESIRDDGPATFVLVVNGDYPEGAPRSTMPGTVLKILPPLPKGLEYRIVDTHLVLIDIEANIIVDYVLDVMCRRC